MKKLLSIVLMLVVLLPASAKKRDDIKYDQKNNVAYGEYERCVMDIYYPKNVENAPVVVWFHGGGLVGGNKYIPEQLKNSGLVVVAANYHFMTKASAAANTPEDQFVPISQCIDDAAMCVAWVKENISKYNGNPDRIFVAGHSAGGFLTSMLGLDKKWLEKYGVDADTIRGYAPFSGQAVTHYEQRGINGIPATTPDIDEFAPIRYVRSDAAPFLIISGDREMELYGRYEEQAYFWRMLKVCGHKDVSLYEMQGYNHGDMPAPGFHILKAFIKRLK